MRLFLIIVLAISVSIAWAGDKDKQSKQNETKPVKVEQPYVKDKGKPADPGAHGRANAAQKQAANPGKGSRNNKDLEVMPLVEKSDKDKAKSKKKKDKDKDKENGRS